MDRLDDLRLFARIIETGSLSAAARDAGTTQPTVSKRLKLLERSVGARLLLRNTRFIRPTDAGELYYQHCTRWLLEFDSLRQQLKPADDDVSGVLRINTAVTFGVGVLSPMLVAFQQAHPSLQVHLVLSDRRVDLVQDQVDLAIRHGRVGNPDLIATPIGGYTFCLVASPAWLKAHGPFESLQALGEQPVLTFTRTPSERVDGPGGPVLLRKDPRVVIDSSLALRQLALHGAGPTLLARFVVDDDLRAGRLVELVPGAQSTPLKAFAVRLPMRPTPPKTRAFLAFLKRALATTPGWVSP